MLTLICVTKCYHPFGGKVARLWKPGETVSRLANDTPVPKHFKVLTKTEDAPPEAEAPSPKTIADMTKKELVAYAAEQYGVEIDAAQAKADIFAAVKALAHAGDGHVIEASQDDLTLPDDDSDDDD